MNLSGGKNRLAIRLTHDKLEALEHGGLDLDRRVVDPWLRLALEIVVQAVMDARMLMRRGVVRDGGRLAEFPRDAKGYFRMVDNYYNRFRAEQLLRWLRGEVEDDEIGMEELMRELGLGLDARRVARALGIDEGGSRNAKGVRV